MHLAKILVEVLFEGDPPVNNMQFQRTNPFKVWKTAKIRKQFNHTQDTIWESNTNTINITNKSQEVSHFLGDHQQWTDTKAWETQDTKNTNDPQKKYRLGTVSKNILLESLTQFHSANLTLSSDVDQGT